MRERKKEKETMFNRDAIWIERMIERKGEKSERERKRKKEGETY